MRPPFGLAFLDFYSSEHRNMWVEFKQGRIYMRNTKHLIDGEIVECIDFANIHIFPHFRGGGVFTDIVGYIEGLADQVGKNVYVENVLEPRFQGFWKKRGYRELKPLDDSPRLTPCYIRSPKEAP